MPEVASKRCFVIASTVIAGYDCAWKEDPRPVQMTANHARLPLPLRACTLSCRLHRRQPLRPWRSPVRSALPLILPCFVTVPSVGTCCARHLGEHTLRSTLRPTRHVPAGSSPCYGLWWWSRRACSVGPGCAATAGPGPLVPWGCPGPGARQTGALSHRPNAPAGRLPSRRRLPTVQTRGVGRRPAIRRITRQ